MFRPLLERLRTEVRGERALDDVRALAAHHRIQSSPGYDQAADWLAARAREAGLAVETPAFPADGVTRFLGFPAPERWSCTRAVATLHGARGPEPLADFARAPLSLVQRSAPARGRWPLVAGGDDAAGDVRGRVVLVPGRIQRAHERLVAGRGAAGLLCDGRRLLPPVRTEAHDPHSLAYTSFWWAGDRPRGWGFVLTPARGAELRARLAAGEALEVEVEIASERGPGTFRVVTATLPGERPGEVLITAHLCHPRPGANDNASGVAAALEAARALAADRAPGRRARRTVRVLWMPEFTGTYAWLAADPGRGARTVCALNLDMVGEDQSQCGSTLLVERAPHFAGTFADELLLRIRHAAQDWVSGFSGPGHYSLVRMADVPYSGGSDHSLWCDPAVGVPCPMLIQWPDRYYHSDLDTPERCDPASLALAARIAAAYAGFLAEAGEPETRWLLACVGRDARRRMLAALDHDRPHEAAEAERLRGLTALASVARLAHGLDPGDPLASPLAAGIPAMAEELEGFYDAEIAPALARSGPRTPAPGAGRVPVRRLSALVSPIRWLAQGFESLSEAERERWLALDDELPGGTTAADLAWFACDGRRTVGEIAARLAAEGHAVEPSALEEWFTLTARMGASDWGPEGG